MVTTSLLITPRQRRALSDTILDRRVKHKVQSKLSLQQLAEDIKAIFASPHLSYFNLKNEYDWMSVEAAIKKGRESVKPIFKEIDYEVLELVKREGIDYCYVLTKDRLIFQPSQTKTKEVRFATFRLFADESEKELRKYVDRPKTLKLNLSLRRIKKRHARGILRQAIKAKYPFPKKEKDAVSIRKIASEIRSSMDP